MNDSFAFTGQLKSSRTGTVILGFHWLQELEVLVITNTGAEIFEVRLPPHAIAERVLPRRPRLMRDIADAPSPANVRWAQLILERGQWRGVKSISQTTAWYTYSVRHSVCAPAPCSCVRV